MSPCRNIFRFAALTICRICRPRSLAVLQSGVDQTESRRGSSDGWWGWVGVRVGSGESFFSFLYLLRNSCEKERGGNDRKTEKREGPERDYLGGTRSLINKEKGLKVVAYLVSWCKEVSSENFTVSSFSNARPCFLSHSPTSLSEPDLLDKWSLGSVRHPHPTPGRETTDRPRPTGRE